MTHYRETFQLQLRHRSHKQHQAAITEPVLSRHIFRITETRVFMSGVVY